jgi:hypothetical protein
MIQKINNCWFSRDELRDRLKTTIPEVQRIARKCFDAVGEIFYT